jgi:hypothetical protein
MDEANRISFFMAPKHRHHPCGPLFPTLSLKGRGSAPPVMGHRRGHLKGERVKGKRVVIAPYGRLMAAPSGSGRGNALVFYPTG